MQIRLANLGDIDQLIRMRWDFTLEFNDSLQNELLEDFEKNCREFLQREMAGDNWVIWVADSSTCRTMGIAKQSGIPHCVAKQHQCSIL